jgi:predicted nucleic acid-binding protein
VFVDAAAVLTAGRRELSLVACTSFACVRRRGMARAFHFDRHFRTQGFSPA